MALLFLFKNLFKVRALIESYIDSKRGLITSSFLRNEIKRQLCMDVLLTQIRRILKHDLGYTYRKVGPQESYVNSQRNILLR